MMSDEANPARAGRTRRPRTHWLADLGFECMHTPGISRAWQLYIDDGYILITDVGGYDLPEIGAPATAYVFSNADEVLEFEEFLNDSQALFNWVRSARRRSRRRSQGGVVEG
jgi:hypothetical protein